MPRVRMLWQPCAAPLLELLVHLPHGFCRPLFCLRSFRPPVLRVAQHLAPDPQGVVKLGESPRSRS
eukprot:2001374-Alexandrium_andersonii.AAC.1